MQVDTTIRIKIDTCIGDYFDEDYVSPDEINEAVEQHIQDFCDEHKIDREFVKIINQEVY